MCLIFIGLSVLCRVVCSLPQMCMWQCAADFSGGSSWGPCRDLLQSSSAAATAAATVGEDLPADTEPQDSVALHQLAKKYGGFMKRYGGFMKRYGGFMKRYGGFMKKSDETYGLSPADVIDDDVDHGREILTFRTERGDGGERGAGAAAEALSALRELLAAKGGADEPGSDGGAVAKRYGGFMRRAGAYDSVSGGARPLQKRYGGFMRRVGWPEWLEESKRYGGFMRRSAGAEEGAEEEEEAAAEEEAGGEEHEPEMEKRYGGFMGY